MKALRSVLLGLAVAIIAALGFRLSHPDFVRQWRTGSVPMAAAVPTEHLNPTAAEARTLVLSRLADAPTFAPFFDRLRTAFPSDYLKVVDQATEGITRGERTPNPDRLMVDAMRALRQTRGVLASQADPGPLTEIFEAQSGMLDALASDPKLCVDFLYGGMSPTFMAFSATHRALVARLGIANLAAVESGQHNHIAHEQPTTDDFETLTTALAAKSLSEDEIAAVLDGKSFDPPLPDARLCEAGRVYLHVLQDMPEEARLRIYALSAELLARS